ncbi:MAG: hypothetical protein MUC49_11490 [Raineya sp.]|jgi:hypothetical protein|nr:hypothetical protein [Raineya sp.]
MAFYPEFEKYLINLDAIRGLDLNWYHSFEGCNPDYPFPNVGVDSLYSIGGTGHDHLVYIPMLHQSPESYPIAVFSEEEGNATTIASSIKTWFPSFLVYHVNSLLKSYQRLKNKTYTNQDLDSILAHRNTIEEFVKVFDNPDFEAILPEIFNCIEKRDEPDNWDYAKFYHIAEKDSYLSQCIHLEMHFPDDLEKQMAYHQKYPFFNKGLRNLFVHLRLEDGYVPFKKIEELEYITPEIAERVLLSNIKVDFGSSGSITRILRLCANILKPKVHNPELDTLLDAIEEDSLLGDIYFELAQRLAETQPLEALNAIQNAIYMHNLDTEEFHEPAFEFLKDFIEIQNDAFYEKYLESKAE